MRTIETQVFTFDELSEEAKKKAINGLSSINLDHEWWDFVYEDAKNVGIKIDGFDTGRSWEINLEFISSAYESASKMMKEHGEMCDTYKTSAQFVKDWDELVGKYSDGVNTSVVADDNEYEFDKEADELEKEFIKSIGHDWLTILRNEEEYRYSEEAVIETINANEYEFTEEGELV